MAPILHGRSRSPEPSSHRAKRLKKNGDGDSTSNSGFDADSLPWKEVTLPDRLDDAEGFYGLEEIDDVEVLKPLGQSKVPRFKITKAPKTSKRGPKRSHAKKEHVPQSASDNSDAADEEWGGISDTEHPLTVSEPTSRPRQPKPEPKVSKESHRKPSQDTKSNVQLDVDFSLLKDKVEEDEIDVSAWRSLDLSPETLSGLAELKFTHPTPIQSACIPEILAGHDVVGKASTGSGKTLAFGIPILEYFLANSRRDARWASVHPKTPIALILSPTRELAHQLTAHLSALNTGAVDKSLRIATVTGGLSIQKQRRLLENADVIIGTPGRVWEVIGQGHGLIDRIKNIKYLVIDEADRLLSEGHFKEAEEILKAIDRKVLDSSDDVPPSAADRRTGQRQTLVFSATFHKALQQKLAGKSKFSADNLLTNRQSLEYLLQRINFQESKPKFIDVNPTSQMATNLREALVECGAMEKDLWLYAVLLFHPPTTRTLIFTNSISSVKRLVPLLQTLTLQALPLHSNMPQKARLRSVERFSSAAAVAVPTKTSTKDTSTSRPARSILVATDVAARGLDIPSIDLIIHYHVPRTADMYVHRSGRTARASESGKSVLLCSPPEVVPVQRLIAKVHSSSSTAAAAATAKVVRPLNIDRSMVVRLRPRVSLAQKIISISIAKSKTSSDENFLRHAAEELGVDYDSSDDLTKMSMGGGDGVEVRRPGREGGEGRQGRGRGRGRGRGGGRERKEKEDASVAKETVQRWRAELREMLAKRIVSRGRNVVSGEDAARILKRGMGDEFLGDVKELWGET